MSEAGIRYEWRLGRELDPGEWQAVHALLATTFRKLGRPTEALGATLDLLRWAGLASVVILLAGTIATNVIGKRFLQRGESILLRVPVFRTIYAPVKQLVVAFSPDNEFGFKRVVMLEDKQGMALGFLTKEFVVERGKGPEEMLAVYVPTNHLYLGDIVICERDRASFPDISVEEGIRIFLTGGMALPSRVGPAREESGSR